MRRILVAVAALSTFVSGLASQAIRLPLDTPDASWTHVAPIPDGARGGAARFADPEARIDAGACAVASTRSFTLRAHVRTRDPGFATALIARDGEQVGLALVLGRKPGCISFEAWSWRSVRLVSKTRVDDGSWHEVRVPYDSKSNMALLFVDGRLEATACLGGGAAAGATLRLGNNIGADQPFRGDLDEVAITAGVDDEQRFAALEPVLSGAEQLERLAAVRARLLPVPARSLLEPERWAARRTEVRGAVADALGLVPLPPRGPLDPRVHGELRGDGFVVRRISWSSWPGYRATGWLWLEDPMTAGRHPAVLCPHGHWPDGAIDPVVQHRTIRFARAGYVVLAVDSVHVEDVASGVSSIGAMTWNNMRALDLLAARDDVDPTRIAVTGASGGGQQTVYLMALDDRVAVAAPIVMACYWQEILADRTAHCACNHAPRLGLAADLPEMCAVFAPKPVLFGSVTGDWTHRFPREGFPELQRLWKELGHEDRVVDVHRDEGHNYDRPFREAVYEFFDRHLAVDRPHGEGAITPFPVAKLYALEPRAAPPDRALLAREHGERRARFTSLAEAAPGLPWKPERAELRPSTQRGDFVAATVTGRDGVAIPLLLRDAAPGSDERWILVDAEAGKAAFAVAPPTWLASRARVALVDPRMRGEWGAFAEAWRRNGILLGRGEGYQAAHDLALVAESLPGKGRVDVVGLGEAGIEALLAAAVSPRIATVVADDLGPRYAEAGNRGPLCPELLRFGDLPAIVHSLTTVEQITLGGVSGKEEYRGAEGVIVRARGVALGDATIASALDTPAAQSRATSRDTELRYRLDVEAALRASSVAPGTKPEAIMRDTVAIVRARLAAAQLAGARVVEAPPLGFTVTANVPSAAGLARLRRLVETPGKLELVMVAAPASAATRAARASLLAWLEHDGNRERVTKEPGLLAAFRGEDQEGVRWATHVVQPDPRRKGAWQHALAQVHGDAVVPLFDPEQLDHPPASATERLVELVALDAAQQTFHGTDLDPELLLAKSFPGDETWGIGYAVRAKSMVAFAELSRRNVGRAQAIVLDGSVLVAPVFQSVVAGGKGVIRGSFTREEAEDLALLLRLGALPLAPVRCDAVR